MEMSTNESTGDLPNSSINDGDKNLDSTVSDALDHGGVEPKNEIVEEARDTLEAIAATGKFWQDWEKLKSMLSFYLNQVLSDYPEAKLTTEEQNSSLGETFQELVKRLDDALRSFIEGPPFTIQRICEILLAARGIYPKLSKLALALEKNLLVTSTLTISSPPTPPIVVPNSDEKTERGSSEDTQLQPISAQNGAEPMVGDGDEIMVEAETEAEAEANDDMTIDMETIDEIARSSETNSTPAIDS